MSNDRLLTFQISADDGCRSPTEIKAKTRQEAIEIFERQTKKKAVHVVGNPYF